MKDLQPNTPEMATGSSPAEHFEHLRDNKDQPGATPAQPNTIDSIEAIRQKIDAHATSIDISAPTAESASETTRIGGIQRELKTQAYQHSLESIRKCLPPIARPFSRFIHARGVEGTSNFLAASLGRPSGMLAGSSVALLCSTALLYAAKHYGFYYNYALTFGLLFVGYVVGVGLELLVLRARSR